MSGKRASFQSISTSLSVCKDTGYSTTISVFRWQSRLRFIGREGTVDSGHNDMRLPIFSITSMPRREQKTSGHWIRIRVGINDRRTCSSSPNRNMSEPFDVLICCLRGWLILSAASTIIALRLFTFSNFSSSVKARSESAITDMLLLRVLGNAALPTRQLRPIGLERLIIL